MFSSVKTSGGVERGGSLTSMGPEILGLEILGVPTGFSLLGTPTHRKPIFFGGSKWPSANLSPYPSFYRTTHQLTHQLAQLASLGLPRLQSRQLSENGAAPSCP